MFGAFSCPPIIHNSFVFLKCFGGFFPRICKVWKNPYLFALSSTLRYNKRTTSTELGEAQRGVLL